MNVTYKIIPHSVEAVQWTGTNLEEVSRFVPPKYQRGKFKDHRAACLDIHTKSCGTKRVLVFDWIIKYADDDFDTCDFERFGTLYTPWSPKEPTGLVEVFEESLSGRELEVFKQKNEYWDRILRQQKYEETFFFNH